MGKGYRFILIFLISLIIVTSYYFNLYKTYFVPTNFVKPTLEFLTNDSTKYDIIVVGNSRALNHFNPKIIDSITHLNSYVVGMDGSDIPYFLMGVKRYLQSHPKPKVMVVTIDFTSINTETVPYNFLEYYDFLTDTTIKNTLKPYAFRFNFKFTYYYYLFEYLSGIDEEKKLDIKKMLNSQIAENQPKSIFLTKGFYGHPEMLDTNQTASIKKFNEKISPLSIQIIESIISICQKENTKIIFVQSPFYYLTPSIVLNYNQIEETISSTIEKNNSLFLDFDTMSISNQYDCFFNYMHLNDKGAAIFSVRFADELNRILNETKIQRKILAPPIEK